MRPMTMIVSAVFGLGLIAGAFGQTAGQDFSKAGNSTKNAAKSAASGTAKAAKTGYHKTKHGVKKGTHAAATGVEKGASKVAGKTQSNPQ